MARFHLMMLATWALCSAWASAKATGSQPAIVLTQDPTRPWLAQPSWLDNPSMLASTTYQNGAVRLNVGQLGTGMKWLRAIDEQIATADLPWVSVCYRAAHLPVESGPFLQLGDVNGKWQPVLSLNQLHADGAWHVLAAKAAPMAVKHLTLQYQADRAEGFVEIARIRFSADKPSWTLAQTLAWNAPPQDMPAGSFHPMALQADTPARRWLAAAGLADVWFEQARVSAAGIPFDVSTNPSDAVAMTSVPDVGRIRIPIGRPAPAIYLLMGAVFTGPESAAIGYGERLRTRQPEHVSIEVVYADGQRERHFPARFPSMGYLVSNEPGVYVAHPTRQEAIDRIELVDRLRNGALAVAAVTVGPCVQVAPPRQIVPEATLLPTRRPARIQHSPVSTADLTLDLDVPSAVLHAANHRASEVQWLAQPTPLYRLDGERESIRAVLTAKPLYHGEIELHLTLTNSGDEPIQIQPTFPLLENLNPGGDRARLGYVFPRQAAVISTEPASLVADYGGHFPVQFMGACYGESGGLTLRTSDLDSTPKRYWLNKTDAIAMGVTYREKTLLPGQTWTLPPAVLGAFRGTWWESVRAYQRWTATWYRPKAPRPRWFREAFNFRQQFLTQKLPESSGMFDPQSRTFSLAKVLATDARAFGGVDMLHLFDWGTSPTHGRVGDYTPWTRLGPPDRLRQALAEVRSAGTPVGLYFEGYLASAESNVAQTHGPAWRALTAKGQPYTPYDRVVVMCANDPAWQDYLASSIERASQQLGAQGYYVDEFGFGRPYPCHHIPHDHAVPSNPLIGEQQGLRKIRERLPADTVLYTEEVPIDITTQAQEGAFSYAVRQIRLGNTPGQVNLTRFIWPEFKTFEILAVDAPVQDDLHGIKLIFYNGEGIWLEGTPPQAWFTPEALAAIRKTHRILSGHREAFTSLRPTPLVPTLRDGVYANQFPATHETVWTLLNTTYRPLHGEVLAVEHLPGATYEDAWQHKPIAARIHNGKAYLPIAIDPRDVSCIVQHRPAAPSPQ